MLKSSRQALVSPLLETEMARVCGWLRSVRPAPVPPYRRGHVVLKSRRPYFVAAKVQTVALEAAWGGVSYEFLIEDMPRYS